MRCLGILSVRENTGEKNKGKVRILEKERFCRKISVVVAEISVSASEVQAMHSWRRRRLFKRGKRFLHRLGSDAVALTQECSRAFWISPQGGMTVEAKVKPEEMPLAMEYALKYYAESPLGKTGWVLDRECRSVCLPIFEAMSQKVQFLGIATGARERAEELEEILCGEYGVNLEILEPDALRKEGAAILVDVDGGRIAFGGKSILSGKKLSLDLNGYEVDLRNLLGEHPQLWDALSFQEWCPRKSG